MRCNETYSNDNVLNNYAFLKDGDVKIAAGASAHHDDS